MLAMLTQSECAEHLRLSERTLERFRVSGCGPKFVRMGKSIRYRLCDVEAWIASRVVGSTSERWDWLLFILVKKI
jgi:predicted DNA-binding transcriptional regulator AlpA